MCCTVRANLYLYAALGRIPRPIAQATPTLRAAGATSATGSGAVEASGEGVGPKRGSKRVPPHPAFKPMFEEALLVHALPRLPALNVLRLNNNVITTEKPATPADAAGAEGGATPPVRLGLASMYALEVLQLGFNQVSDIAALRLGALPSLKILHLQGNDIGAAGPALAHSLIDAADEREMNAAGANGFAFSPTRR